MFKHHILPRQHTNDAQLIAILDALMSPYVERVPQVKTVVKHINERKDNLLNDHIAFRSLNIISMLKIFCHYNYEVCFDTYSNRPLNFKKKKLTAVWLKHPNLDMPRIFVSQYRLKEGSQALQDCVKKVLSQWQDPIENINLDKPDEVVAYLQQGAWKKPSFKDYQLIQKESEYLAWVLYNQYFLNHFTLTVHSLKSFKFEDEIIALLEPFRQSFKESRDEKVVQAAQEGLLGLYKQHMQRFNKFLIDLGLKLNTVSESQLNISSDGLLLQSSTKAESILASFEDGDYDIPGSYVEFAYRGLLDLESILALSEPLKQLKYYDRRDGFDVLNADAIFESTYEGKQLYSKETCVKSVYEQDCEQIFNWLNF